jgi:hypothetical protein
VGEELSDVVGEEFRLFERREVPRGISVQRWTL